MTQMTKSRCYLLTLLNEIYQDQLQFIDHSYSKKSLNLPQVFDKYLDELIKYEEVRENIFKIFDEKPSNRQHSDLIGFLNEAIDKISNKINTKHQEIAGKYGIASTLPHIPNECNKEINSIEDAIQYLNEIDFIPKFYYLNKERFPRVKKTNTLF